jgi:hypothetical protein
MGTAVYIGTNPQAKQQSAAFSGTDLVESIVNEYGVPLRLFLDEVETLVK